MKKNRNALTLQDLLALSEKDKFAPTQEDLEWINMKPVGREILGSENEDVIPFARRLFSGDQDAAKES